MTSASAVFAILASAVIVLGGLVALVRAIWKIAQTIRDNTRATAVLSGKMTGLTSVVDGRLGDIEKRLAALEAGRP